MFTHMFRKADVFMIIIICLVAAILIFLFNGENSGDYVKVTRYGEELGEYPLDIPHIEDIKNSDGIIINKLEIYGGKVGMIYADCPDKICLKQGEISFSNQTIVCLPNGVVIEVSKSRADEYDAIVN